MWTTSLTTLDPCAHQAFLIGNPDFSAQGIVSELTRRKYAISDLRGLSDWASRPSIKAVRLLVILYSSTLQCDLIEYMKGRGSWDSYVYTVLISDSPLAANVHQELVDVGIDEILVAPFSIEQFSHRMQVAGRFLEIEDQAISELNDRAKASDAMQSMNESLTAASRRFEALFNGLPVACFTFDQEGLIQEWNSLSTEIFGLKGWEVFMNPVWDALDPDGMGDWRYQKVADIFEAEDYPDFDWSYHKPDGSEVYLACKVVCLTNERGERVAAVAGNLDITARVLAQRKIDEQVAEIQKYTRKLEKQSRQLGAANKKLHELAVTDGLTGLTNRRKFQEMLTDFCESYRRENQTFSLLLFDVDHFKNFNDAFGHQAGDEVLKKFSRVLEKQARKYERPARFGGEEFAVILQNCDASEATLVAERFRAAIEQQAWPYRPVTASIGISTFTGIETPKEMIEGADKGLYESKRTGRNRSTHIFTIEASANQTEKAA